MGWRDMVVETMETPVQDPAPTAMFAPMSPLPSAPAPEDRALPYYPSRKYIDRNWAPERALNKDDFAAIAKAKKHALETGALSPDLAEYLLPMAIAEGRSGQYGILSGEKHGFYAHPETIDRFKRMGLEFGPEGHVNVRDIPEKGPHVIPVMAAGKNTPDDYARLMAAILSEKAALYSKGDPLLAVERYNGQGEAEEYLGGDQWQKADSKQYVSKVLEARKMLDHPKNKQMKDFFAAAYAAR